MFMANLCVTEPLRGNRLFTELFDQAIAEGKELGLAKLEFDVSDNNPNAERAYRKYGFVEVHYRPYQGQLDLPGFRRMELPLDD